MADENISSKARIIDAKFTEQKNRKGFRYYFKWTIFVLVTIIILGSYVAYKLNNDLKNNYAKAKHEIKMVETKPVSPTASAEPNVEEAEITAPVESPEELNKVKSNVADLEARLEKLEDRDADLTIYLAIMDLKNSLNNPENFKLALATLKSAAEDVPEDNGRLDILDQASLNGLVTTEKLSADLVKVKEQLKTSSGSFGDDVKNIFSDLVRVTKVSGEVKSTDYQSIIKRTELKLSKENLTAQTLDNMIKEMENIGKPADDFVREANNLKRVLEVIESLSASAKQSLIE